MPFGKRASTQINIRPLGRGCWRSGIQERPDRKAIWPFFRKVARLLADLRYVLGRGTLLALHDLKLDALAFGEGLEARSTNRRVMNEAILRTILRRDESKALRVVEPLYSTGRTHSFVLFLVLVGVGMPYDHK